MVWPAAATTTTAATTTVTRAFFTARAGYGSIAWLWPGHGVSVFQCAPALTTAATNAPGTLAAIARGTDAPDAAASWWDGKRWRSWRQCKRAHQSAEKPAETIIREGNVARACCSACCRSQWTAISTVASSPARTAATAGTTSATGAADALRDVTLAPFAAERAFA